jgi:hypothetical protein
MKKAPSERIDSVVWYTYNELQPIARMWKILEGLSWNYTFLGTISTASSSLNNLKHQWDDLESLTLRNFNDDLFIECAPKIFSRISSLTLDYCVDGLRKCANFGWLRVARIT